MAAWVCTGCTTTYSVGAPRCPHCGSTDHIEEGAEDMPKITVHGGPTVAGAAVVGGAWSSEGDADVWPAQEEGGEESSPGTSSSTSPEKPSSDTELSDKPARSRARKTASPSKKDQTDGSSAPSTDGDQTAVSSAGASADGK